MEKFRQKVYWKLWLISMAVIHTESFEQEMMELVRFSVSTKIAESLMYGPCLIAYGPDGNRINRLSERK